MPKTYRVVKGSDQFTWEYIDEDNWLLLAESHERWPTQDEVKKEIRAMSGNDRKIVDGRDGKGKPPEKNPRKGTGSKGD